MKVLKGNIKVPQNFGKWVKRRRTKLGMPLQKQLIYRANVGERTIKNIESGKKFLFQYPILMELAKVLEIDFEVMLRLIENDDLETFDENMGKWIFKNIYDVCTNVDEKIIELFRNVRGSVNSQQFYDTFKDLLSYKLKQMLDVELEEFFSTHKKPDILEFIVDTIPTPKLIINVDDNFENIVYEFDGTMYSVNKPQLLWPCSCKTSTPQNCKIHSSIHGEKLSKLIENEFIEIKWKNYSFLWVNCKSLWPPSIDSFNFLETIFLKHNQSKMRYSSVLDIGCGTGFLGLISADYFNAKEIHLSDWTCVSYLFSIINYYKNNLFKKMDLYFLIGMDFHWINYFEEKLFDLILCNPPYLPIPEEFSELRAMHTVAGTDLLSKVISEGSQYGSNIFIQYSNIADVDIDSIVENKKREIRIEEVQNSSITVPFRVRIALENKEYIKWLASNGLIEKKDSPYLYFHNISIFNVKKI